MPSIDAQDARDREIVEEMNIQNSDTQPKNGDQKKCLFIYNNKNKNHFTGLPKPNLVSTLSSMFISPILSNPFSNPQSHCLRGSRDATDLLPDRWEHLPRNGVPVRKRLRPPRSLLIELGVEPELRQRDRGPLRFLNA